MITHLDLFAFLLACFFLIYGVFFFGGGGMGKGVHPVSSLSVPLVSIPVN